MYARVCLALCVCVCVRECVRRERVCVKTKCVCSDVEREGELLFPPPQKKGRRNRLLNICRYTCTHTHTHKRTLTHTLTRTHTHALVLTHTHTHTHTNCTTKTKEISRPAAVSLPVSRAGVTCARHGNHRVPCGRLDNS